METLLKEMYSHGEDIKLELSLCQSSDGQMKTVYQLVTQLTGSLEIQDSSTKLNLFKWLIWTDLDSDWKLGSITTLTMQTWKSSETMPSNSQELHHSDFGDQNETEQQLPRAYKETWRDSRLQYMSQDIDLFSNLYDKWHITKMYNLSSP